MRVWNVDISRFKLGGSGVGARDFVGGGIDGDESGDLMFEAGEQGLAVSFGFDEFAAGGGPFCSHALDGGNGFGKVHSCSRLVQQVTVSAFDGPDLADHIVGGRRLLEAQVPALDQFVNRLGDCDGVMMGDGAVSEAHGNGREGSVLRLPVAKP